MVATLELIHCGNHDLPVLKIHKKCSKNKNIKAKCSIFNDSVFREIQFKYYRLVIIIEWLNSIWIN